MYRLFKTMKNIPMKVETRILAFSDSHATANDRVTGESSIVAFRATALKNGSCNLNPGISFSNFFHGLIYIS